MKNACFILVLVSILLIIFYRTADAEDKIKTNVKEDQKKEKNIEIKKPLTFLESLNIHIKNQKKEKK